METQPTFQYLCRVCAANTKGKNSVPECVYILRTPALREKIEKYLYFTIEENDPLPKVLCKTCFRQVEATASLSKIATHTQKVFRDFMVHAKVPSVSSDFNISMEPNPAASTSNNNSTTSPDTSSRANSSPRAHDDTLTAATISSDNNLLLSGADNPIVDEPLEPIHPEPAAAPTQEVVVNVSINDPLTRENSSKLIHASQKRQNTQDNKFTPKSIAQRSAKLATSSSNLSQKSPKKTSPAAVLNFVGGPQHSQQVMFTSGGYVIGRMEPSVPKSTASSSSSTPSEVGRNQLQQKRKNLKMALSNIRASASASSSGQISLLKSSQKPQQQQQPVAPPNEPPQEAEALRKTTESVATKVSDPHVASPAEKTPTAASKRNSKSPQRSPVATKRAAAAQRRADHLMPPPPPPPQPQQAAATPLASTEPQTQPQPQPHPQPSMHPSGIPEDIVLGRVIRDHDLQKLILKALKWPLTEKTMELQMQRLRNSKFLEIMADPNLLQDMDLTQILGPYLAPVFMAAQAIQQQQWALATAAVAARAANASAQENASAAASPALTNPAEAPAAATPAMPYKLPAETSVQLISVNEPATSGDDAAVAATEKSQRMKRDVCNTQPKHVHPKKMRKTSSSKGIEALVIVSDEDASQANDSSRRRLYRSSSKLNVEIDPTSLYNYGVSAAIEEENSNEALFALLHRQRQVLSRLKIKSQRRNSTTSVPDTNVNREQRFNIEDIVLMEQRAPQIENEEPPSDRNLYTSTSASSLSTTQMSAFALPAKKSPPLITRPIIKRRKTVIHSSSTMFTPPAGTNVVPQLAESAAAARSATKTPAHSVQSSNTLSIGKAQNTIATHMSSQLTSIASQMPSEGDQMPAKTVAATCTVATSSVKVSPSCTAHNVVKSATLPAKTGRKSNSNKSTLRQQLLEAIGLQKIDSQYALQETLARSVSEALQQKRAKQEEPTVAHADSTTKSVVKEVLVEAKKKNASDGCTEFDVEDQIDKIALVVQSNTKQPPQQQAHRSVKEEPGTPLEKERKAPPATRMLNMRRYSTSMAVKSRKSTPVFMDHRTAARYEANAMKELPKATKSKNPSRFYHADDDTASAKEAEKLDLSFSSTTSCSLNSSDTNTATTTTPVPRKRGRKRNEDKDPDFVEHRFDSTADQPPPRERGTGRAAALLAKQRVREMESESKTKMDFETTSNSSPTRPARVSKTLSKYYKGPNRGSSVKRSLSHGSRPTKTRN